MIPEIDHGSVESKVTDDGRFVSGSEVKYACNPGSHVFPGDTIVCDPSKDWNVESLPQCVPGERSSMKQK